MGVAGKLLRQSERGGVHRMGAANLDDPVKLFGFCLQRRVQGAQTGQGHISCGHGCGNMHGCGEGVIGRLAHVAMIIGMHRIFRANHPAHHFNRAVGNHLIGVHVGLRA